MTVEHRTVNGRSVTPLNLGTPPWHRTADLDWTENRVRALQITPEIAETWLQRNTHNRNIRPHVVEHYAQDMRAGNWVSNGETIKFSVEGVLIDGQHRVSAVVASGATVTMLVVTGLAGEVQDTIDTGRKRTAGDALTLHGERDAHSLAAVVRRAVLWDAKIMIFSGGGKTLVSNSDTIEFLDAHPEIRHSLSVARTVRKGGLMAPASIMGLAHWIFSGIDATDCDWFFARVADGADLPASHPVLHLRKRLMEVLPGGRRYSEEYLLAFTIKTWNAYRAGKSMQLLVYRPGGPAPESFPEPV